MPERAIVSAHRILRKGGRIVILDLLSHRFERARELYADVWLGFKESALHAFLKKAGVGKVEVAMVARETEEPYFETLLATATPHSGDEDRFTPLRVARRIAAKYRAPLRVLPGRAHLMMQEPGWAEAAGQIGGWLGSV